MKSAEAVVTENLRRLLRTDDGGSLPLDLNRRLEQEYGLTSLDKILLMTAVCEDAAVSLMTFTEGDIAAMTTAQNVIDALNARRK